MKAFAEAWPDESILQQLAAKLPWFHNCVLLEKVKAPQERIWYIEQAIHNGWSRNVLVLQIESGLYRRQGRPSRTSIRRFLNHNPILPSNLSRTHTTSTF
jgi:predicted nuclease of restriction endonuclease-like (RecB) superfamily